MGHTMNPLCGCCGRLQVFRTDQGAYACPACDALGAWPAVMGERVADGAKLGNLLPWVEFILSEPARPFDWSEYPDL